ncbi:HNH endonuclease [Kitasatospora indigofera]|uniref:HNH endonuclease n=1 Tax=Kitasatospora indigofera TaxID=67307 RepID=UPI003631850D
MTIKYDQEVVQAAVAAAASLDEALLALGREPNDYRRRYLCDKLAEWAIDASHLGPAGTTYTKELLEEAAAASHSIAGVVRYLGRRQTGGTQAHIGRRLRHFGIDMSHFTGQAHNRGKKFPSKFRPEEILVRRAEGLKRLPGSRIRQALSELGRAEVCEGCGIGPEWQGRQLTLEVDHISGDWSDNRAENVRLLCPNCHATTDTYCGRNKNRRASSMKADQVPPQRQMTVSTERQTP